MSQPSSSFRWLWRTPAGVILSCATVGVIAYAAWAFYIADRPQFYLVDKIVASLGLFLLNGLIGIFGMQVASQPAFDMRLRRGWRLLALAAFSNSIAEVIWLYFDSIANTNPFPSIADPFYLLFYPLTLWGVLRLPFAPIKRRDQYILSLDLTIVMVASTTVFWYFILAPIQNQAAPGLAGIVAIAYPIGDLLIFAGVVALIQRDVEKLARGTLFLLASGMIFITFADVLFAYLEIYNISRPLSQLTIMWLAAALCHLAAAIWQLVSGRNVVDGPAEASSASIRLMRLLLPYLAAAVGPILLVLVITSVAPFDKLHVRGLLVGTLLLVGLVLFRQYTVLVENMRLTAEMQRLAITDSLTGLYNRHFFNQSFQQEFKRARRYEKPLSILLMDVDNFKSFNDTFGHLQGDEVLKTIAKILSQHLRSTDTLARFGGDEFAVILPETERAGAQAVAEKMGNAVAAHSFGNRLFGVSIGVAMYRTDLTPERMIEEADEELYRCKAAIKSQIVD